MAKGKKKEHLRTMERRRDQLISKQGTTFYNSWVAAELGAIVYAIELIEEKIAEEELNRKAQDGTRGTAGDGDRGD